MCAAGPAQVVLSGATGQGELAVVQDNVAVTIVDDDEGGVLSFELPTLTVSMEISGLSCMQGRGAVSCGVPSPVAMGQAQQHGWLRIMHMVLPSVSKHLCGLHVASP